jgi:hypothetical protein
MRPICKIRSSVLQRSLKFDRFRGLLHWTLSRQTLFRIYACPNTRFPWSFPGVLKMNDNMAAEFRCRTPILSTKTTPLCQLTAAWHAGTTLHLLIRPRTSGHGGMPAALSNLDVLVIQFSTTFRIHNSRALTPRTVEPQEWIFYGDFVDSCRLCPITTDGARLPKCNRGISWVLAS